MAVVLCYVEQYLTVESGFVSAKVNMNGQYLQFAAQLLNERGLLHTCIVLFGGEDTVEGSGFGKDSLNITIGKRMVVTEGKQLSLRILLLHIMEHIFRMGNTCNQQRRTR